MNDDSYLILNNSKKAMLIFSIFRPIDLIIFGIGVLVTFLLFMVFQGLNLWTSLLVAMPLLITGLLVFPLPNYHNTMVFLGQIYKYLNNTKRYEWRGWCYKYETSKK